MKKNITTGTKQLIAENNDGILSILLNNPKYKNALSEDLTPYLRKILKSISKDKTIKALLIRGKGDSFCSGGNIKKMNGKETKKPSLNKRVTELETKQKQLTGLLYSLNIPTIAVITGAAAGAGFALALACDLRIGNLNSFFVSNYSRIGLSGDYGISWFLNNIVGESKAKEIMFLNNRIYSSEAKELGLLNMIIEKDFDKELNKLVSSLSNQSPIALKYIKKNIVNAKKNSLNTLLKQEALHLIKCTETEEHKKAVENFKKK